MRAPSADDPSTPVEAAGPGSLVGDRRLRAACRLALDVVRAGELADPPVPSPHGLHKVLGFQRLSGVAYDTVARAVDDDPGLRARVAAEGDEASVGRAGWLWLHRPDGWATDPAWLAEETASDDGDGGPTPAGGTRRSRAKGKARAETELARQRREADEARTGQREARKELAQLRRDLAVAHAEKAELSDRVTALGEERNQAVRTAKAAEADLAGARRNLKLAKEATIDAEAELAALRSATATAAETGPKGSAAASAASAPGDPAAGGQLAAAAGPVIDAASASAAVAAAASAAADLGVALARAASALEPRSSKASALPAQGDEPRPGPQGRHRPGPKGRGRRPAHRAVASLPPGIFDGTPEANRHLVSGGEAMLVVDGYNVARTTWPDLSPREDRQRVVALLEAVQARSGGDVVVVFDGESGTVAPHHSRAIRVVFSATGVTADDHIADLVASLPPERPVVVVSSDRAVMADAKRHGATALSSPAFLTAAGR